MAQRPVVACPHCACLHERVPIQAGATANCTRCGFALYRQSGVSLRGWVALTWAALFIFGIATFFPVATVRVRGLNVQASLPDALRLTWQQGHEVVAIMTGLFGFIIPFTQTFFLLWALMALLSKRLPGDFRFGMRMLRVMSDWSMVPVLMLGIFVAIVKLTSLAAITIGPGLWAIAALAMLLTGLSRVSAHRLWRYAEDAGLVPISMANTGPGHIVAACASCGCVQNIHSTSKAQPCRRCGARVHFRIPDSIARTWALIIAAGILYIPANILPVMYIRNPAGVTAHTILGGVIELWQMGSWDLAIIVFVASVVVPMSKLLSLSVLMVKRQWQGVAVQRQRTRLYELVEFVGQWSMLDVFVVILLTAMADFPGISQITAGSGAASFGLVVIFTMLAAMSYDPRSGWDNAATCYHGGRNLAAATEQASSPGDGARRVV